MPIDMEKQNTVWQDLPESIPWDSKIDSVCMGVMLEVTNKSINKLHRDFEQLKKRLDEIEKGE